MIKTKWTHPLQRLETLIANTCHLDSLSRSFCLLAYQQYPFISIRPFILPRFVDNNSIEFSHFYYSSPLLFSWLNHHNVHIPFPNFFAVFFFLINWEHVSRVVAETLNNTSGGYIDIDIAFLLLFEHSLFQALSN